MNETEQIKRALLMKQPIPTYDESDLLSTGSTLLNLACSGKASGGFLKGHYIFFVGDSDSGKTFLCLSCLAEAAKNPAFDKYWLIYDAVEHGALMNIERFFGKKTAKRLEPPAVDGVGNPIYSRTTDDFYFHLHDAVNGKKPFIYILDSQDSLTSKREDDKFDLRKRKARGKASKSDEKKSDSDYGDGKAKAHSSTLRKFMGPLNESGSILIIINQSRDSFDPFKNQSYSGGRALKFYATLQIWSKKIGKIEKTHRGKKRQQGVKCKVHVMKNRVDGKDRTIEVPIFHSYGVDDVRSCIDYLVDEGEWKKDKSGVITATGMGPDQKMKVNKLIRWIEDSGMTDDLRGLVQDCWHEIEDAVSLKRRPRYE